MVSDPCYMIFPSADGIYTVLSWNKTVSCRACGNNAGWRIDYFLVSDRMKDRIVDAKIHTDIFGSDHCPVELEIRL